MILLYNDNITLLYNDIIILLYNDTITIYTHIVYINTFVLDALALWDLLKGRYKLNIFIIIIILLLYNNTVILF